MAGNLDLILEAAKFNASSVSSSEASTTAASLTDSESHLYPNEQEHYSDELGKYYNTYLPASRLHCISAA